MLEREETLGLPIFSKKQQKTRTNIAIKPPFIDLSFIFEPISSVLFFSFFCFLSVSLIPLWCLEVEGSVIHFYLFTWVIYMRCTSIQWLQNFFKSRRLIVDHCYHQNIWLIVPNTLDLELTYIASQMQLAIWVVLTWCSLENSCMLIVKWLILFNFKCIFVFVIYNFFHSN